MVSTTGDGQPAYNNLASSISNVCSSLGKGNCVTIERIISLERVGHEFNLTYTSSSQPEASISLTAIDSARYLLLPQQMICRHISGSQYNGSCEWALAFAAAVSPKIRPDSARAIWLSASLCGKTRGKCQRKRFVLVYAMRSRRMTWRYCCTWTHEASREQ